FVEDVRPGDLHRRARGGDRLQDEAGAAADLEEAPRRRKVARERPQDQPIARLEPEIAGFDRRQLRVLLGAEAARRALRRGCKSTHGRYWRPRPRAGNGSMLVLRIIAGGPRRSTTACGSPAFCSRSGLSRNGRCATIALAYSGVM